MGVRDKIVKAIADRVGIKAYHSSPHDFDKFDLSKIGTGEGAQVYGHGLYFAENPAVSGQGGQYWNQFMRHPALTEAQQRGGGRLASEGFDMEKAIAAARRDVSDWQEILSNPELSSTARSFSDKAHPQKMLEMRQAELDALISGKVGPRTYEVNIKADPAQFLDWDKPLREQPAVFDAARAADKVGGGFQDPSSASGKMFYHALARRTNPAMTGVEASQLLNEAGVPGIKYLDQGSRAAGTGSSNYVVFDPSTVDILKKYGVVGAPAGALGMGALADQSQYEVSQ